MRGGARPRRSGRAAPEAPAGAELEAAALPPESATPIAQPVPEPAPATEPQPAAEPQAAQPQPVAEPQAAEPQAAETEPDPDAKPKAAPRRRTSRRSQAADATEEPADVLIKVPLEELSPERPRPSASAPEEKPAESSGEEAAEPAEAPPFLAAKPVHPAPHHAPQRAASPAPEAANRTDLVRFARLHLRTGSLIRARSEYEALAASERLDLEGTLDLAEVRWRTADLPGAGLAAAAYVAQGGLDSLGFLIAAEAAAGEDRMADAREFAGKASGPAVAGLESLFAGIPRRLEWPDGVWTAPSQDVASWPEPFVGIATRVEIVEVTSPASAAGVAPLEAEVELEPIEVEAVEVESVEVFEAQTPAVETPAPTPEVAPVAEVEPEAEVAPEVAPAPELAPAPEVELASAPEAEAELAPAPELAPEAEAELAPAAEVVPEAELETQVAPAAQFAPEAELAPPASVAPEVAPAGSAAAEPWLTEIEAGKAALGADDALLAALHMAIALRMSPAAAPAILEAIEGRRELAFELVRNDALRLAPQAEAVPPDPETEPQSQPGPVAGDPEASPEADRPGIKWE